jgi:GAF domain-containing protein
VTVACSFPIRPAKRRAGSGRCRASLVRLGRPLRSDRALTQEDQIILTDLAGQIAIATENARRLETA